MGQSPRTRYLEQIEASSQTNLLAYRFGTNLDLRIPLRGKDAFAHAAWAPVDPGSTNYQHRFAMLKFGEEKRGIRRATTTKTNRVVVHDYKQWQQIVQKVFANLAPSQANHAVVMLVQNQEMALFHDGTGKLRIVKLEEKPPAVVVDRTCNDADFLREALPMLDRRETQFLFVAGADPAFVFVDSQQRLMVFLDYSSDPESQPVPVWFAVKALNSLLFKSLVITAIKNPVTLVCRGFWHIGTSGATALERAGSVPEGPPPPLANGPPMDLAEWEKHLDHAVSGRRYKGRIDLLIDGEKFYPALIESVSRAVRSVNVHVFIFDTDDYAVRIANLLMDRSIDLKVKVLLDDLGSIFAAQVAPESPMSPDFQRPSNIKSYLRDSWVRVRASANPWLTADHRKCIVVDSREAYVGGMNIGRSYRYDWHDLMVRVTGPVVGHLERDFRLAWAHAGPGGDFAYAWYWLFDHTSPRKNIVHDPYDIRVLRTATWKLEIYRAQYDAIESAQKYIYIENPYFDDETCLRALIRARYRGVDVRVILPAQNDSGIMQVGNSLIAGRMIRAGIRVYAYPGMTHLKAAVYDGWACLGSANFNKMSLRVNQELDLAFSDPKAVAQLNHDLFETDIARSHEITDPGATSWYDSVMKAFIEQL